MSFVYILSNWDNSVLYIGVTSNSPTRLYERQHHLMVKKQKDWLITQTNPDWKDLSRIWK